MIQCAMIDNKQMHPILSHYKHKITHIITSNLSGKIAILLKLQTQLRIYKNQCMCYMIVCMPHFKPRLCVFG